MITTIIATSFGFSTPVFDDKFLSGFSTYMKKGHNLYKIWGGITLTMDLVLSIVLAFLIFWSKDGIYHYDHRKYHKYTSVTYETMLPPTVCVLILVSLGNLSGSPFTDMRRIFTVILPLLYWNSFLQTLVGRRHIRNIKESRRNDEITNGLINENNNGEILNESKGFSFKSNRDGPRIFVSPPRKL
nr:uncharacterized protein I206_02512 [Kwoniella pini CBS 10737]OCF51796.1 hypothetical protein I206_02512 [Kwoniella pini CBS 10737]